MYDPPPTLLPRERGGEAYFRPMSPLTAWEWKRYHWVIFDAPPLRSQAKTSSREEAVQSSTKQCVLTGVAALAFALAAPAAQADDITIGFVTHAQGDPLVEQIVDEREGGGEEYRRHAEG